MKKIILAFCFSILSLGVMANAATVDKVDGIEVSSQSVENDKSKAEKKLNDLIGKSKLIKSQGGCPNRIDKKTDSKGKVVYIKGYQYNESCKLTVYFYGKPHNFDENMGMNQKNIMFVFYDVNGRIAGKQFVKSNGKVSYVELRGYYKNRVMALKVKGYLYDNGKVKKDDTSIFYTNKKIKERLVRKFDKSKRKTAATLTKYSKKKNNRKVTLFKGYFKKGNQVKANIFAYNKVGQLKSNKNGKAYKYVVSIKKKRIITKTTKAQYNKKGKLGAAKVIKPSKFTLKVIFN